VLRWARRSMNVKLHRKRTLIVRSLALVACISAFHTSAVLADTESDCRDSLNKGDANLSEDRIVSEKCYKKALTLAAKITSPIKSEEMRMQATSKLAYFYDNDDQRTQAEKYYRDLVKMYESSKADRWSDQASAYACLGVALRKEGKIEEGQRFEDKGKSFRESSFKSHQIANDNKQLAQFLSDYNSYLKVPANKYPYEQARQIARWYVLHNQLDKAQPYCVKIVEHCKNPKNYFDSGAEWDERRRKGEPTEGTETVMIDGKPTTALVIDNRRPSGKLDRGDLVRFLVALSLIDEKLGKKTEAAQTMDEAKKNYSKYQFEKLGKFFQSFDAFVVDKKRSPISGEPEIPALLQW
jgi:tetratricopeptide (TPR) repeat protein